METVSIAFKYLVAFVDLGQSKMCLGFDSQLQNFSKEKKSHIIFSLSDLCHFPLIVLRNGKLLPMMHFILSFGKLIK